MKLLLILIFTLLLISYLLTNTLLYKKRKRSIRFYLLFSEILLISLGYIFSLIFIKNIPEVLIKDFKFFALIAITLISFLSGLEFRIKSIKKIPYAYALLSTISILIIYAIAIFLLFIFNIFEHGILLSVLFLCSSSFMLIAYTRSHDIRKIILTGLFSPVIVIILALIIHSGFTVLNNTYIYILMYFLFLSAFYIGSLFINYLSHLFEKIYWTIAVIAFLLIIIPFSIYFNIIPVIIAFLIGILITNNNASYADFFANLFSQTLKPLFLIILFISGMFARFELKIILIFLIILIIKVCILFFIGKQQLKIGIVSLAGLGVSGFELTAFLSLYFMNLITPSVLGAFLVFMILSQFIQRGVLYVNVNK